MAGDLGGPAPSSAAKEARAEARDKLHLAMELLKELLAGGYIAIERKIITLRKKLPARR